MATIQSPTVPANIQEVDSSFAGRIALYPAGGNWFQIGVESGALAGAAAGASVFSMRNFSPTIKVWVSRIGIRYFLTTAFGAAQELGLDFFRVSNWSASDTAQTGITFLPRLSLTGVSIFAGAVAGDMRISNTAAITAGTRTLDTQPFFRKSVTGMNTINTIVLDEVVEINENGDSPLILGQNEGIIISPKVTLGATGVMRLQVRPRWREI